MFDIDVSNSLIAGIIQGTSNFQDFKLNPKTFQKISFLMRKGGNFQKIFSNLHRIKTNNSFLLFRKVLNKLEFSDDKNLGWVTLTNEDFQSSYSFPSDLPFTFDALISSVFPFRDFLCLWENKSSPISIWGVFYSPNNKKVVEIENYFHGSKKGNGVLFQTKETNLQKAKDEIIDFI